MIIWEFSYIFDKNKCIKYSINILLKNMVLLRSMIQFLCRIQYVQINNEIKIIKNYILIYILKRKLNLSTGEIDFLFLIQRGFSFKKMKHLENIMMYFSIKYYSALTFRVCQLKYIVKIYIHNYADVQV